MAKRFRFNLETVLNVRHIRAEERKKAFADAQRRALDAEAALRELESDEAAGKEFLAGLTRGRVDIQQVRLQKQYLHGLNRRIIEAGLVLDRCRAEQEERRRELVAALRDERAMELLRDKRRREWQYEADRGEQKMLDDLRTLTLDHERHQGVNHEQD